MQSVIDDPTQASRYLADQLTDEECARYEARFLEDPAAVQELEATARLKIGLERLRRNGELSELIAGTGAAHPGRTWMLALAASLCALVIGVSLWYPRAGTGTGSPLLAASAGAFKDRTGHVLSVLVTAPLYRTRAERFDAVIELPSARGAIKLRVLPSAATDAKIYQASLARIRDDDSPERVVQLNGLHASDADGFVDVYADSSLLEPGRYRLVLSRDTAGSGTSDAPAESDTFVIKVNAPR